MDIFRSENSVLTPAVKHLLIINVICYVASLVLPRTLGGFDLNGWAGLHYWASGAFSPIQLVSYMFMHGSLDHIFCNMFAVFMFGPVIERTWGTRKFLVYYFVAGLGAALTQELIWTIELQPLLSAVNEAAATGNGALLESHRAELGKYFQITGQLGSFPPSELAGLQGMFHAHVVDRMVTIGASGSVFGLLLAFGWLFPDAKMMLLFLPIPISSRIFVAIYALVELFAGVANFSGDSVAHFAHLGGMLFGWILLLYWRKRGKLYDYEPETRFFE